ncbi:hypothetical protein M9Y10_042218 [Tritrichomonas musculus]|uniref:Small GTP-binding protein n=1 Tax=Tritrichomonas musculus TaxID=1915356 RepID=A0ABR2K6N6_9EUKA
MNKNVVYRVAIIGDFGVGKTSILNRLINNSYSTAIESTIGPSDFRFQINKDGVLYKIQFTDMPGDIKFSSAMPLLFRNCSFAIAVFDLTNQATLDNLNDWVDKFRSNCNEKHEILVVGNKLDNKQILSDSIIQPAVEKMDINYLSNYISVSAKSGENFSELLQLIGNVIEIISKPYAIEIKKISEDKTNSCCNIL